MSSLYAVYAFTTIIIMGLSKEEKVTAKPLWWNRLKVFLIYYTGFFILHGCIPKGVAFIGLEKCPEPPLSVVLFMAVEITVFALNPMTFSPKDGLRKWGSWGAKWIILYAIELMINAYMALNPWQTNFHKLFMTALLLFILWCPLILKKIGYHMSANIYAMLFYDVLFFYLGYRVYSTDVSTDLMYGALTVAIIVCFNLFFLLLTGRFSISIILVGVLYFLWTLVHYYVLLFRGTVFIPADWRSAGTAKEVVDAYQFVVTKEIWWYAAILMAVIYILCQSKKSDIPLKKWIRFPLCVLFCIGVTTAYQKIDLIEKFDLVIPSWEQTKYYQLYGYTLGYYISQKNQEIAEPEGYNTREIRELVQMYEDGAAEEAVQPNIIIIMNEAFADVGDVGELHTNKDYMPFIHLAQEAEDYAVGRVLVSAYGGSTCNSEWEFLTGYSMELAPGVVPYITESFENTYSLCSLLKDKGYRTVATHPSLVTNWRRNSVYRQMRFDEMYFIDDYENYELIRGLHVSDRDVYRKVIDLLNQDQGEAPVFMFAITMQNHGGYTDVRLRDGEEFEIKEEAINDASLDQYLSLLYESDMAFRELTEEVDKMGEPTVVVMFGDHFPSLNSSIYQTLWGSAPVNIQTTYATPYIVHANYNIDYQEFEDFMSVNYLGANLFRAVGLGTTPFQNFQLVMQEVVPAFNSIGYMDTEGNWYGYDPCDLPAYGWLQQYNRITYNARFDRNNTVKAFFGGD